MAAPFGQKIRDTWFPHPVLAFGVWIFIGLLSYTRHYLQDTPHGSAAGFWIGLPVWLSCFLPWTLLTPPLMHLETKFPLSRRQWPSHLPVLALASVPFTFGALGLTAAMNLGFGRLLLEAGSQVHLRSILTWDELWLQCLVYWSIIGAACVFRNLASLHENERRAAQLALEKSELEASLHQAELTALRMRLNPHFLFNTLQNISVLTQRDPKTATRMLAQLGDLLRATLRDHPQQETTLAAEIALAEAYVAVEKVRFGNRLSVLFDIAAGTEQSLIPSFLLQPLIENAIVHGLDDATAGLIVVKSVQEQERLTVSVTDNGIGFCGDDIGKLERGVGLGATCERLNLLYGERHQITISRRPEGGAEVRIVLPLRFAEAVAEASDERSAVVNR